MAHLALAFGFIGHLYAIKTAADWDMRKPSGPKDLWWAAMQSWSLATFGRPFNRPRGN